MIKTKNSYYSSGMQYFYKNKLTRSVITFIYDLNWYCWNHKIKVYPYIPTWKIMYLYTTDDYYKNIYSINRLIKNSDMGKVLRCNVCGKDVFMIVIYTINNRWMDKIIPSCVMNSNEYSKLNLDFSKKIRNNVYISQGEGMHRYDCNRSELNKYFTGKNYYRYRR